MSFQQGLSGLNGSSAALDAIGNNIANSGTVGFKGATARFADIYAASLSGAGSNQIGIGTNMASVFQQFTQGNLTTTNNPLDAAINGGGFYRLSDSTAAGTGTAYYTRNGQFSVDKSGYIVSSGGLYLTGLLPDPTTGIIPNSGPASAIKLDSSLINPQATATSAIGLNLDSRETVPSVTPFSTTNPQTYNASTTQTVYDSLGNPHNFQMYFVKSATPNQWFMYTQIDGDATTLNDPASNPLVPAGAGPIQLDFNAAGGLTTTMPLTQAGAVPTALWPTTGYSMAATTGANPILFTLDLTSTTQYGNSFGVNSQDVGGYAPGRLTGVSIAADGTVNGQYSNGQLRAMGRLVLSTFQNPNGLMNMGGNVWTETYTSGQPVTGTPGQGSLGVIQSGSVEDSNIDLTHELVDMIVQQRAYQANAQTIKTQDQILQTLVNLR